MAADEPGTDGDPVPGCHDPGRASGDGARVGVACQDGDAGADVDGAGAADWAAAHGCGPCCDAGCDPGWGAAGWDVPGQVGSPGRDVAGAPAGPDDEVRRGGAAGAAGAAPFGWFVVAVPPHPAGEDPAGGWPHGTGAGAWGRCEGGADAARGCCGGIPVGCGGDAGRVCCGAAAGRAG
ncbi:hypothetical protein [Cellulomonas chitinilytica]|uniref:hypothetical protein n=1 Tax=Cellulomonas chitinilytica TaxID=398759 RepID=UPI001942F035|nr:hypothetical protein [Cellulomonas chitinilytica]